VTGGVSTEVASDAEGVLLMVETESEELGIDCPAPKEAIVCRGVTWEFPFLEELGRGSKEAPEDELVADKEPGAV